jgi:hypothetical protein
MDRPIAGERAAGTAAPDAGEAMEFIRFCHRRRHVGWPELYDEMCAVAGRGLYRGDGTEELSSIGIGFGLFQMPALAGLVAQVVAEDVERRRRSAAAIRASLEAPDAAPSITSVEEAGSAPVAEPIARRIVPEPVETGSPDVGPLRLAVAAGA